MKMSAAEFRKLTNEPKMPIKPKKPTIHGNRGMGLEMLVGYANEQYASEGIATIQKVPTSVKVTRIDKGRIKDGFFEKDSTVDFIGVYRGVAVAFDAKSTNEKTSYPLAGIEKHQMEFMERWEKNGGRAFFLIELVDRQETYFVNYCWMQKWWDIMNAGGRKSILISDIRGLDLCEIGKGGLCLDYLRHVVTA